ncbi:MAG: GntR family transcriptional regulator [Eubacterium sp.]|nr:GntR family transcriptional regulator [Eubacterium sp.]
MIQINYRDSRPIYEQVKDGFRKQIIQGILKKDEKLPSVRELATGLTINPNTISRAYRELEHEGYIYTSQGRGCFVAGVPEKNEKRISELKENLKKTVEELKFLGVRKEEVDDYWN